MPTITIARTVHVDPEKAWRAWVDPAELARWWWPHLADTAYDWDVREGAAYRIESAEAGFGVRGTFTVVDPPRRLVCSWIWQSGEPGRESEDSVEVTFESQGDDATVVTVRHTSETHEEAGGALQGWTAVMDRLAARAWSGPVARPGQSVGEMGRGVADQ